MEDKKPIKEFVSTHNLPFLVAEYSGKFIDGYDWKLFKIGTCQGLWSVDEKSYYILAIDNSELNNGHFNDVLEWFENCCKKHGRSLKFLEIWNTGFKKHLITKRGFTMISEYNAEKKFE